MSGKLLVQRRYTRIPKEGVDIITEALRLIFN